MNTNLYLTSRMLFSLGRGNYAPAILGRLGRNHTPLAGVLVSGVGILLVASVSAFTPKAYNYLFGIALFGGLSVWIIILLSHFRFRQRYRADQLPVRMPFFPLFQIAGLLLLVAILITMGLDTEFWDVSWIVGVPWFVLITLSYYLWRRRPKLEATV
jgi:L-asparagine transporter-like permease